MSHVDRCPTFRPLKIPKFLSKAPKTLFLLNMTDTTKILPKEIGQAEDIQGTYVEGRSTD